MFQNNHLPLFQAKYSLRCTDCGATYPADPFRLFCDRDHPAALLRAEYSHKQLEVKPYLPGIFRYIDWLPVERVLSKAGKPVTYQSKHLSRSLGLENLFICFNGYWPERGIYLRSCSFKELEALAVLARIPLSTSKTLVVSSAGNTGRAFAQIATQQSFPVCLVTPEKNLSAYWSHHPFADNVFLVAVAKPADYTEAIRLGKRISQLEGFFLEGGANNVARRDGMGLTVLDAAVTLGKIPDHYFQAVGSGTGGIAAWEANLRLIEDGRFGSHRMRLHLSQNAPFTPLVDAWTQGKQQIDPISERDSKPLIDAVSAQVLTTRTPAYGLTGGLYDALRDTRGRMYAVTNQEAEQASLLFEELEGIDISPAASVATASLMQAVEAGYIHKQDVVLLNITSGGRKRLHQDYPLHYLHPRLVLSPQSIVTDSIRRQMTPYFEESVEYSSL